MLLDYYNIQTECYYYSVDERVAIDCLLFYGAHLEDWHMQSGYLDQELIKYFYIVQFLCHLDSQLNNEYR